jgi:hypothetical protein
VSSQFRESSLEIGELHRILAHFTFSIQG